jgi:transposase
MAHADEEEEQYDVDQILAEASPTQIRAAEAIVEAKIANGEITNGQDRLRAIADLVIEMDEAEAHQEVQKRLGLMDKGIQRAQQATEADAAEHRRNQYPEWWDEYREAVATQKIRGTQNARILFFLQKGMLVKDVAKMLGVRYQIVYQTASWHDLAGPKEGQVTCKVCGRPLIQPNSTARGTGPICAKGGKHK